MAPVALTLFFLVASTAGGEASRRRLPSDADGPLMPQDFDLFDAEPIPHEEAAPRVIPELFEVADEVDSTIFHSVSSEAGGADDEATRNGDAANSTSVEAMKNGKSSKSQKAEKRSKSSKSKDEKKTKKTKRSKKNKSSKSNKDAGSKNPTENSTPTPTQHPITMSPTSSQFPSSSPSKTSPKNVATTTLTLMLKDVEVPSDQDEQERLLVVVEETVKSSIPPAPSGVTYDVDVDFSTSRRTRNLHDKGRIGDRDLANDISVDVNIIMSRNCEATMCDMQDQLSAVTILSEVQDDIVSDVNDGAFLSNMIQIANDKGVTSLSSSSVDPIDKESFTKIEVTTVTPEPTISPSSTTPTWSPTFDYSDTPEVTFYEVFHLVLKVSDYTAITDNDAAKLEEATLNYLNANIGGNNSFTFGNMAILGNATNETISLCGSAESTDTINCKDKAHESVVVKVNATITMKEGFINEIEGGINSAELAFLTGTCTAAEHAKCCISGAINQDANSAWCQKKGCNSDRCAKKPQCKINMWQNCCDNGALNPGADTDKESCKAEGCVKAFCEAHPNVYPEWFPSNIASAMEDGSEEEDPYFNKRFIDIIKKADLTGMNPLGAHSALEVANPQAIAHCSAVHDSLMYVQYILNDTNYGDDDWYSYWDDDWSYDDDDDFDSPSFQPTTSSKPSASSSPSSSFQPSMSPSLSTNPTASTVPSSSPSLSASPSSSVLPTSQPSSCDETLRIEVKTDRFPSETSIELIDDNETIFSTGNFSDSGQKYSFDVCVANDGTEYLFRIEDSFGDGLCCGYGRGRFRIEFRNMILFDSIDEDVTFRYEYEFSFTLGIAPSFQPSFSSKPTTSPRPSNYPSTSLNPTSIPSSTPTDLPSVSPEPTTAPSSRPSSSPSFHPSSVPSHSSKPSVSPLPSASPSLSTSPSSSLLPSSQPSSCYEKLLVEVRTDSYPYETFIEILDSDNNTILSAGGEIFLSGNETYSFGVCVDFGRTYLFRIEDSYGDGLCCFEGSGKFSLEIGSDVLLDSEEQGITFSYKYEFPFFVGIAPSFQPSVSSKPTTSSRPSTEPSTSLAPTSSPSSRPSFDFLFDDDNVFGTIMYVCGPDYFDATVNCLTNTACPTGLSCPSGQVCFAIPSCQNPPSFAVATQMPTYPPSTTSPTQLLNAPSQEEILPFPGAAPAAPPRPKQRKTKTQKRRLQSDNSWYESLRINYCQDYFQNSCGHYVDIICDGNDSYWCRLPCDEVTIPTAAPSISKAPTASPTVSSRPSVSSSPTSVITFEEIIFEDSCDWCNPRVAIDGNTAAVVFNDTIHILSKVYGSYQKEAELDIYLEEFYSESMTIAISGSVVVVGIPEVYGEEFEGAVFVYEKGNSAQWTNTATLTSSNPSWYYSGFGRSVDVDGNLIVVGDPYFNDGVVIVYRKVGSSWLEEEFPMLDDDWKLDNFGSSVTVKGNRIAIADRYYGSYDYGYQVDHAIGAVFIFKYISGSWQQQTTITVTADECNYGFGDGVVLIEDGIVIGCDAYYAGGVVYYEKPYNKKHKLAPNEYSFRTFAANGDRLVIQYAYGVHIFDKTTGVWVFESKIDYPEVAYNSYFGDSVGISGNNLVASSTFNVLSFTVGETSWPTVSPAPSASPSTSSSPTSTATFEEIIFDVDCDHCNPLVAIDGDTSAVAFNHSIHILSKVYGDFEREAEFEISLDNFYFGSIAISGNVVVAGVPGIYGDDEVENTVFVFEKDESGVWAKTTTLVVPFDCDYWCSSDFGRVVDVDGESNVIAVGDQYFNDGSGAIFVYRKIGSEWEEEAVLVIDDPKTSSFGSSVSVRSSVIAIGDSDYGGYYNVKNGQGAVFIFAHDSEQSWQRRQGKITSGGDCRYGFGSFVALTDYDELMIRCNDYNDAGVYYFKLDDMSNYALEQVIKSPGSSMAADSERLVVMDYDSVNVFEKVSGVWVRESTVDHPEKYGCYGCSAYSISISGKNLLAATEFNVLSFTVGKTSWPSVSPSPSASPSTSLQPSISFPPTVSPSTSFSPTSIASFDSTLFEDDCSYCYPRVAIDGDTAAVMSNKTLYIFSKVNSDFQSESEFEIEFESFYFGAIRISGNVVVAGIPDIYGEDMPSAALVFEKDGSGVWTNTATLIPSVHGDYSDFGLTVDVDGDSNVIVVGDYYLDGGTVFVYRKIGSSWEEEEAIVLDDPRSEYFGSSVSVKGNRIAIGESEYGYYDADYIQEANTGAVFLYEYDLITSKWQQSVGIYAEDNCRYGFGRDVFLTEVGEVTIGCYDGPVYNFALASDLDDYVLRQVINATYYSAMSAEGDILAVSYANGDTYVYEKVNGVWIIEASVEVPVEGYYYVNDLAVSGGDLLLATGTNVYSFTVGQLN